MQIKNDVNLLFSQNFPIPTAYEQGMIDAIESFILALPDEIKNNREIILNCINTVMDGYANNLL
jgi:hypothetical protein